MAREYETTLRLNAQVDGKFSSAFKSAQAEMARFSAEYRNLSSTARDISGYQRQQTAVENTRSKLEHLQTQYDNIQREMDETGGFSSDLANNQDAIKQKIEQTTKAYQDQVDRLNEYKRRLEEAGVDTTDLDKELKRLREELKRAKEGFKDTGDGAEDFGDKGKSSLEDVSAALAASGIVAGLKKIYDAFDACVDVSADFEESMSNVEAISGASGAELTALTDRAKDLGSTTSFTAQQVSEGMSYMAMAGWKTNDMLDGMDAVLALAAASGEDLATTSDIVTDALTAFGLTAQDTGRFADVLAAASSNANTNVSMMGETFKYAAPVAGALGYSIEDVAVVTGLMANSGIKASQAGTTLRNIFNGLLNGVELTGDAIGEVNLTFENADGTMMDLASSVDKLRGYFEQMTQAERVHNAINIAGQRGYSGLLAILNATTEDYDKLTTSINNSSGAAQKMADIKLDNLNGQMTKAKSEFEGLEIAVGETLTPVLEKMYAKLADILGGVTQYVKDNPEVVKGIAGVATGLGVFVVAVTAAKIAQAAFNAVAAMNPYVLLASAVAGVIVGMVALCEAVETTIDPMEQINAIGYEQEKELEALRAQYEAVAEAEGEASANAILLKSELEKETAAVEGSKETLGEWLNRMQSIHDEFQNRADDYADAMKDIDNGETGLNALIDKLIELSSQSSLTAGDLEILQAVIDEINKRLPDANLHFDISSGNLNMTTSQLHDLADAYAETQRQAVRSQTYLDSYAQQDALNDAVKEAEAELTAAKSRLADAVDKYNNAGYYIGLPGGYGQVRVGRSEEKGLMEAAAVEVSDAQSVYDQAVADAQANADLIAELEGTIIQEGNAAAASVAGVFDQYSDRISALTEAYTTAYTAAKESIEGQYKLWDDVAKVSATSVDSVIGNLEKQKEYWDNYNTNIQTLLQYSGDIEGLSEMVASFGDGSQESVNMIAGMAQAASSGDTTKLEGLVKAWQENKTAQDEAAQSLADLQTGYTDTMNEIGDQITEDVKNLDKSSEAVTAGSNTIMGFINGAKSLLPYVQRVYQKIGAAAARALEEGNTSNHHVGQTSTAGYASGTSYAAQGWHLVGESGPEFIWFNGGEQVLNALETEAFRRDAALYRFSGAEPVSAIPNSSAGDRVVVNFSPVYQLSGDMDSEEVREILARHDAELEQRIRDTIEDIRVDEGRRAYV